MFKLTHRQAAAEIGDLGRGCVGIDRAADQGQRVGLRLGIGFGQKGGCRECDRDRLADRDNMNVGAEMAHEIDEVECVILDVELAGADRNVARILPVGDIDIAIRQQAFDR